MEFNVLAVIIAMIAGVIGGLVKYLFKLEKEPIFSVIQLVIDCLIGLGVGLLAGSICLNYDLEIYALIAVSLLAGMLGKEFVDIVVELLRVKFRDKP